eukprot:4692038-Pyramimonas_sp.AAC.1
MIVWSARDILAQLFVSLEASSNKCLLAGDILGKFLASLEIRRRAFRRGVGVSSGPFLAP